MHKAFFTGYREKDKTLLWIMEDDSPEGCRRAREQLSKHQTNDFHSWSINPATNPTVKIYYYPDLKHIIQLEV